MISISLKQFALTGNFGPVTTGMHRDEAVSFLGEPGNEAKFGKFASGFIYGWYEFFYETDSKLIYAIQNDHLQADCLNHAEMFLYQNRYFQIDPWFLEAGRDFSFDEIAKILNQEQVPFRIVQREVETIEFESGVFFDFNNRHNIETGEDTDEMVLWGIRYFPDF